MPLTKRSISPVRLSLHRLPPNVRENELECVANGTLANLVRQMSSLSRHAENIFGELFREAVKIEHKTSILFNRIDRIALKVTQLDSNVEEVSLQDLHLRKPFKSSALIDQQSLSRQTMPLAMTECYGKCDRPPELDKLNPYRTDSKSALKFYTDPDYFFELWRQEMLKDADHPKRTKNVHKPKSSGEKKRKSPRQPHDHRQKFYDKAIRTGEYIQHAPADYQSAETLRQQAMTNGRLGANGQTPAGMIRPESLELHHAQGVYDSSSGYGSMSSNMSHARVVAPSADYRQPSAPQHYNASSSSNYGVLSRNQLQGGGGRDYNGGAASMTNSGYSAAGSTPTLQDGNQMSPQSISSSDSSGQSRAGSRPAQPPPAPPPMPVGGGQPPQSVRPAPPLPETNSVNGDVRQQLARMQIDSNSSAAEILRYSRTVSPMRSQQAAFSVSQSASHERSTSPDLPPPPPPLYSENFTIVDVRESTPSKGNGYSAPPPPPPPPTTFNGFSPDKQRETSVPTSGSFQTSNDQRTNAAKPSSKPSATMVDGRSDLLRAIRDGFQLKKVDRKEEKEREEDAATKGHDVAAILKRRMEDVMGHGSESDESASDFDDDWDD